MNMSASGNNSNDETKQQTNGLRAVSADEIHASNEDKLLEKWKREDTFQESIRRNKDLPPYTFYDGPPFATGLPHYGHILAGNIKDTVTRWAHQTGHHVSRRFGWDCHGLPIEFMIDKQLDIKSVDDVHAMGIDKYNEECRGVVMKYSKEWREVVTRMGRWIDFVNDYKTLDTPFMESVWWVFKQIHDKDLVYKGYKVMPYSTACSTPLSNFESGQNYRNVQDPAVTVSFPWIGHELNASFLAWTTTPWTLTSNLALCVHPEFVYLLVLDTATSKHYVIAECRIEHVYPKPKGKKKKQASNSEQQPYTIVKKYTGAELVGAAYEPMFPYFQELKQEHKNMFTIISDTYVTDDVGTGIVHNAPGFGEDDYRVCLKFEVIAKNQEVPCPIDANGRFTPEVPDFKGIYVKTADNAIVKHIRGLGRMVIENVLMHSYPHCWRSDTPLLYRAIPSWFVDVPAVRDRLVKNNQEGTYWVPSSVKEKRFHNWLTDAREWCISRNRFWGTPIPIWSNDDGSEVVVIGSIEELKEKTGCKEEITDLHMHNIDHLTIPSQKNPDGPPLKRIPEVFDCWFESGSMPYAQCHYPFENKSAFEAGFPADFIAEGLDQTRGWFYTLMVIGTILFDNAPFKNLIVNGLVLASDKKKMSKRLKNYPDPMDVVSKYGADALRIYLIDSPVVRAEPLCFKEEGVRGVVRDVFIPWFNSYKFLCEQALRRSENWQYDQSVSQHTANLMDKWLLSSFQSLVAFVTQEMAAYRLYTVIPRLLAFVDQMSKWYVRLNKDRLKGDEGTEECDFALSTLFEVLYGLCRLMAPFTPFLAETMYLNLRNALPVEDRLDSVHFCEIPVVDEGKIDVGIETSVEILQHTVDLGRKIREKLNGLSFRVPLKHMMVTHLSREEVEALKLCENYLLGGLNVQTVTYVEDFKGIVHFQCEPNMRSVGKKAGKEVRDARKAISELTQDTLAEFALYVRQQEQKAEDASPPTHTITLPSGKELVLSPDDITINLSFGGDESVYIADSDGALVVAIQRTPDQHCLNVGRLRDISSRCQRLRKEAKLNVTDKCTVAIVVPSAEHAVHSLVSDHLEMMNTLLRTSVSVVVGDVDKLPLVSEKVAAVVQADVEFESSVIYRYGIVLTRV